ncbi:MAG: C4-dicarboxylate ABC transporter substrate-binding protein [Firmicutes bacterium HGW-Firmicutes-12]|jgi:tripartite ATP-independent transporter DctP family solute receptor|nr:MAG: C4-dicarboxylate ABC transporter substrate-binding protein [Firmicutes bacterium HGW-Firmicutes-12]
MSKKMVLLLIIVLLAFSLVACSGDKPAATDPAATPEPITLKAGVVIDQTHPYSLGILKFGEIVSEKTDGRITVQLFHSSQLGNERDMIEGMSMGSVDMAAVSSAPVSSFVPKIAVFDLPYLFTSREQAYKVMDGPIGAQFFQDLLEDKIIGLGWFENGFREITNSKRPINTPEDLKGIKIRVMESPVPIATFKAVGANATPMAWGEVFTALQQGTIDAQENPLPVIYTQKLYEVQKYLSLTDHFYAPALFLMSEATYNKMSPEDQKIIMEAAQEATIYERGVSKQQAEDYVSKCEEEGMIVNTVDKTLFVDAMESVYAEFESDLGKDLIDAIKNTK